MDKVFKIFICIILFLAGICVGVLSKTDTDIETPDESGDVQTKQECTLAYIPISTGKSVSVIPTQQCREVPVNQESGR